jgi:hypothetical protein
MIDVRVRERAEAHLHATCELCDDRLVVSSLDPLKGLAVRDFTDRHAGHQPIIRIG